MDQYIHPNGINNSTQNQSSNSESQEQTIVFGREKFKNEREKLKVLSCIGNEKIRRSSMHQQSQQMNENENKVFQESIILDRRSDSLNHEQSLNHFINSKLNSEVVQEKQPKEIPSISQSNLRSQSKLTVHHHLHHHHHHQNNNSNNNYQQHKEVHAYSQVSRNMSSIMPPSYYQSSQSQKIMKHQMTADELATFQEHREPHASHLSDENGRIINQIQDANDKYFYKSGLKGIIYLVSESSHAAVVILPYFFSQFGILTGIILILTLINVSNYSFVYLLKAKNLSRRSNYHTIAQFLSGINGYRFIFIIQFFTKFSNCTLLMHFAAKQMQQFVLNMQDKQVFSESELSFAESFGFYLIIMSVCMIALSLFVVVNHQTTFTQLINLCFLLVMIILTLISFINTLQTEELKGDFIFTPDDFQFGYAFSTLALLFFLLDIHINFFNVYKFMRKPSDKKMLRTSLYANMILGLCFILIGSFGYITTTALDRNVNYLVSFSQLNLHLTFSSIALLVFVLYCLINFPLQFSIARSHLLKVIRSVKSDKKFSSLYEFPSDHLEQDRFYPPQLFYKSSSHDINQNNNNNYYQSQPQTPLPNQFGPYNNYQQNDLTGQFLPDDEYKQFEEQNVQQSKFTENQIRFYAITIIIFLLMVIINFFVTDPFIIVLISGVFFSSVNAFIIPIAFYIKLSNYESTIVVIISVFLLFTIFGLDFTALLGEVFTLIE